MKVRYKGKILNVLPDPYGDTKYYDEEANRVEISGKPKLEPVSYDYDKLKDHVVDMCYHFPFARNIFNALARRLEPDYYVVGAKVYIDNFGPYVTSTLDTTPSYQRNIWGKAVGINCPYEISEIRKVNSDVGDSGYRVYLLRLNMLCDPQNGEIYFEMFPDRFSLNDVYFNLIRYDKEI